MLLISSCISCSVLVDTGYKFQTVTVNSMAIAIHHKEQIHNAMFLVLLYKTRATYNKNSLKRERIDKLYLISKHWVFYVKCISTTIDMKLSNLYIMIEF